MLKQKWRLAVAAAGSVLIVAGCSAPGDGDPAQTEPQAASEQAAQDRDESAGGGAAQGQGPDTSNIPDPVAVVNGEAITKAEFVSVLEGQYQQMSMQAQMSGQPVDEEQIKQLSIEGLVGSALLEQEAADRGIEVSDEEKDASLREFADTNQVSTDEFVAKMGEQGMDRAGVMDQIEKQLRVEKLITQEYGEFSPSDDEVRAAYDQVAQQQSMMGGAEGGAGAQQLPPLEQVRPQVEEQLRAEKQAEQMQTMSDELREGADVTVNL